MPKRSYSKTLRLIGISSMALSLWSGSSTSSWALDDTATSMSPALQNGLIVVWDKSQGTAKHQSLKVNGITVKQQEIVPNMSLIHVKTPEEYRDVMQKLSDDPNVLSVEPNYSIKLPELHKESVLSQDMKSKKLIAAAEGENAPNDPYYKRQWALSTMHVPEAWSMLQPAKKSVTVAVIDSGVDLNHPELKNSLLPGKDYVDHDSKPEDENGHGTHVAGIIAAQTNNNAGIAGLASMFDVKILPLRVLDAKGEGTLADEVKAIRAAADMGADVINLSLGSSQYSQAEEQAISYAISQGAIVVAAAGNEHGKVDYPGALKNAIAVAATTPNDTVADFSNFGPQMDVAAPGTEILSTYPTKLDNSGYIYMSGTSMATPEVTALVALLRSQVPELTQAEVEEILQKSSTDIMKTGKDNYSGYGRVDFEKAVQLLQQKYPSQDDANKLSLNKLRQNPESFYKLLTTTSKNKLTFTLPDGTSHTLADLLQNLSELEKVLSSDASLTMDKHGDRSTPFVTPGNWSWNTQKVSTYASFSLTLDATLSAQDWSRYLKLVDQSGNEIDQLTIHHGKDNKLYIAVNSDLKLKTTYRLMLADDLPLAQFTTIDKTPSIGKKIGKKINVQSDIPVSGTFSIHVDSPLNLKQLKSSNIWVVDEKGKKVKVSFTLSDDKQTLNVTLRSSLQYGSVYYLVILESNQAGRATLVPLRTVFE